MGKVRKYPEFSEALNNAHERLALFAEWTDTDALLLNSPVDLGTKPALASAVLEELEAGGIEIATVRPE